MNRLQFIKLKQNNYNLLLLLSSISNPLSLVWIKNRKYSKINLKAIMQITRTATKETNKLFQISICKMFCLKRTLRPFCGNINVVKS